MTVHKERKKEEPLPDFSLFVCWKQSLVMWNEGIIIQPTHKKVDEEYISNNNKSKSHL